MSSAIAVGKHRAATPARGTAVRRAVGGAMVGGAMTAAFVGLGSIGTANADTALCPIPGCELPNLSGGSLIGGGSDPAALIGGALNPGVGLALFDPILDNPLTMAFTFGMIGNGADGTALHPDGFNGGMLSGCCSVAVATVTARPQPPILPSQAPTVVVGATVACSAVTAEVAVTARTQPLSEGSKLLPLATAVVAVTPGRSPVAVVLGVRGATPPTSLARRWAATVPTAAGNGGDAGDGGNETGGNGGWSSQRLHPHIDCDDARPSWGAGIVP